MTKPNLELIEQVRQLADGTRTSVQIADILGRNPRHIRKILLRYDLPRLREGAQLGQKNHQHQSGRRIALNGYVWITPPEGHPTAKPRLGRIAGRMMEHRWVMEQKLGRLLLPHERVDHVDGLTLHNHPDNLRVFASNGEHLRETLAGKIPKWSQEGYQNMFLRHHQPEALILVDTYRQRIKSGDVRLRQILLAALRFGIDSPYLLGTKHWLEKAGISDFSRPTIERALADLYQRWGWDQIP